MKPAAVRAPLLSRSKAAALAALSLAVLAVHLFLAGEVMLPRLGEGAGDGPPKRMEVSFVRELRQSAPAPVAVTPKPAPRRATAVAPAPAASAASIEAPPPPELPPVLAQTEAAPPTAPEPVPPLPASEAAAASVPVASSPVVTAAAPTVTAAASAPSFEWPPSTRLSYTLTGNVRGPVQGQARVEWLRSGTRYQVMMDVSVGPSFAPLMSRRATSEGEITAEGLSPRRYDEETKAVLRSPRRLTVWLDPDRVRLPDGRELARPSGVQDSVSQFVHLTWLFTTQPEWLTPGRTIEMPIALPRHLQPWTYEVIGHETLHTPFGALDTVHVKPRREAKGSGDLLAEFWVAPSLQYLPVRVLIRQEGDNYIDLLIERLPQQAEAAAAPPLR